MFKSAKILFLGLFIATIGLLPVQAAEQIQPTDTAQRQEEKFYKVTKTVDGDTIEVQIGKKKEKIRLIGVDTPETKDPRKPVQCFGKEASAVTKKKLLNKKVHLEVDAKQGEKDKYQRVLAYIILEDGTNFNEWLIKEGYAFEYTYNVPYKYQKQFKNAEKYAMENNRGLWDENTCNGNGRKKSATSKDNHAFYLSKMAKTKYYCDTDDTWKNLSQTNLLRYESEEKLKKDFPKLTLNKPC
jgi:micrococcal nuclease